MGIKCHPPPLKFQDWYQINNLVETNTEVYNIHTFMSNSSLYGRRSQLVILQFCIILLIMSQNDKFSSK